MIFYDNNSLLDNKCLNSLSVLSWREESKRDDSNKHSSHLTRRAAFLQVDHVAIIKVHHPWYVYGNSCLAGYVNPQNLSATTIT